MAISPLTGTTDARAYRNDVKHPLNQTRSFVFDWFDRL
jgi:hypothetical protein